MTSPAPIVEVLDTLLLVFIVIELVGGAATASSAADRRALPHRRHHRADQGDRCVGEGGGRHRHRRAFRDQLQIAVLGVVVLLLGVTAWLLRRDASPAKGHRRHDEVGAVGPGGRRRIRSVRLVPLAGRAREIRRRRSTVAAAATSPTRRATRSTCSSTAPSTSPGWSFERLSTGRSVHFTDWRGDPTNDSTAQGTRSPGSWRSGPGEASRWPGVAVASSTRRTSATGEPHLVETVNEAEARCWRLTSGGDVQPPSKLLVVRHPDRPDDDVAFAGGIDLPRSPRRRAS